MQKKNYRMKKTISMKLFISEFGEKFSLHMKERLMDLEIRCVLTRKEDENVLDLKHVEHTKFDCNDDGSSDSCEKEYAFGQLIVVEGILYFSQNCTENDEIMQSPIVSQIYNVLESKDKILFGDIEAKKIDDSNIDYLIDNILTVCPEVSEKYIDILKQMKSYVNR